MAQERRPSSQPSTEVADIPTKDGARTQAVSCRWRPLWRSAPLNLVADSTLSGQERKRVVYVSKILAEHPGPALRFELPYIRERYYGKTECWLRSQALTNLQELDLGYDVEGSLPSSLPLPPSALRFAPTLHVARFSGCRFPDLSAPSLNFPHLNQLTLYGVTISGGALHSMLTGCVSLESLLLQRNVGIVRLRISSLTLRSIGFSGPFERGDATIFQELVIEDAPCIERLLPLYPDSGPRIIQVIRAPKLRVLGLLSDGISKLHIGTTVFQEMTALSLVE